MIKDIIPFYNTSGKIIVKSKGCYQYDSEGKEYIDFESGVWCANIGYSHEGLIEFIKQQVEASIHHGYPFRNEYSEKLSRKLQQLIGFEDGASVFLSSGSEAVDLSITLAQHVTGRKKILKIDYSYLSAYGFGKISVDNDFLISITPDSTQHLPDIDFKNIAAFVIETGGASMGVVRFPETELINKIVNQAKENGCLIIAEEVTTGFGRLGKWFGFQHYDFLPDLVATGKALGSGYPVSAVTVNSALLEAFMQAPFRYAQSHQNDPLGCSIGLETIRIIEEEGLIEKAQITGSYFKGQLDRITDKFRSLVKESRSRGMMLALEFNENVNVDFIASQLFDSGFIVGCKLNTLRFLPPLIIENRAIDRMITQLDTLLNQLVNSSCQPRTKPFISISKSSET